jgi:hypothetical protein
MSNIRCATFNPNSAKPSFSVFRVAVPSQINNIYKQEVLGRANLLLSFDTTWTA